MTRTFGRLKTWQWGVVIVWALASGAAFGGVPQLIGALGAAYVVVLAVTMGYRKLRPEKTDAVPA